MSSLFLAKNPLLFVTKLILLANRNPVRIFSDEYVSFQNSYEFVFVFLQYFQEMWDFHLLNDKCRFYTMVYRM